MIGTLESVVIPVEELLGLHVLDGVRVSSFVEDDRAISFAWRPSQLMLRLDGVVYLLQGHPLRVRRLPEGPLDLGIPRKARGGEDRDDEDEDDGDGHYDPWVDLLLLHDVPPLDPIVCSIFRRPARLGSDVAELIRTRSIAPATDRMDETSDRLLLIDERTGAALLEVGAAWVEYSPRGRVALPIGSASALVRPGHVMEVAARPQQTTFRPECLIIGGTPGDWVVDDVRIGNRSQFMQAEAGGIPGDLFSAQAIDSFVSFEVVSPAADIALQVRYVGPDPEGAAFVGAFLGEVSEPPTMRRRLSVRWVPEGFWQGWMLGLVGELENRDVPPGVSPERWAAQGEAAQGEAEAWMDASAALSLHALETEDLAPELGAPPGPPAGARVVDSESR